MSTEEWRAPEPTAPSGPPPGPPIALPTQARWLTRDELIFAARLAAGLVVLGAIAGLIWRLWAPGATRGLVYYQNAIVPDETEGFISSDGKFLIITAVVGVLAAVISWRVVRHRGPATAAALAVGGFAGAAVADLIGYLVGGGSTAGKLGTQLPRLPLRVHSYGLLFVEGALALFVYLLATLFAASDDLGATPDDADPARATADAALSSG